MGLTLDEKTLKLLAYKQLKYDEVQCAPYDGFTKEDQLGFFVDKNGYNPFEESKKIWADLEDLFLSEELKGEFHVYHKTLSEEWKKFCDKLEELMPCELSKDVFINEYTSRCSSR